MKQRLFKFVVGHPLWVILISVILVMAAAAGAQKLVFKSDYRVFFGEENPQLTAYEAMQKIYSKSDNVAFILAPKDGNIFSREHLEAIRQLSEASWQIPYSTRVDSITNYQYSYAEGDDLIVEDLALDPLALDQDGVERVRKIATSELMLLNKLISPEGDVSVVNATIQLPGINPVEEIPEVAIKVRAIRDAFLEQNPDFDVMLSGMVMMNNTFAESSLNDNATLVPIMFGVVLVTLILLLRTFTGTISTVTVILFSIAATMGLAGWTGFYLTGPSAGTPIMILTLAVADCVHVMTTMLYEMRHGVEKRKAIIDSLKINFQPIFLTSATTAIGFL
ncbi:MAG: MMPL family transporter, partial [Candidatus Sedimenticola sp. 6PFRAG5]